MSACCLCGGACGTENIVAVIDMSAFESIPDDCMSCDPHAIEMGYEGWNDGRTVFTKAGVLEGRVLHTGVDGMWTRIDVSNSMTDEEMMDNNVDLRGRAAHLGCASGLWRRVAEGAPAVLA